MVSQLLQTVISLHCIVINTVSEWHSLFILFSFQIMYFNDKTQACATSKVIYLQWYVYNKHIISAFDIMYTYYGHTCNQENMDRDQTISICLLHRTRDEANLALWHHLADLQIREQYLHNFW
jgi:hypothetical protein